MNLKDNREPWCPLAIVLEPASKAHEDYQDRYGEFSLPAGEAKAAQIANDAIEKMMGKNVIQFKGKAQ